MTRLMQWSGLKVQRISCIENTKLESKGEGNASTFRSILLVSSSLATFQARFLSCDIRGRLCSYASHYSLFGKTVVGFNYDICRRYCALP
jgi:hypothetical protein